MVVLAALVDFVVWPVVVAVTWLRCIGGCVGVARLLPLLLQWMFSVQVIVAV